MHSSSDFTRRSLLKRAALSCGWLSLAEMICGRASYGADVDDGRGRDVKVRAPDFDAPAKRMILLFQHGGPSHVDLFDPKPALAKYEGQPMPGGVEAFFDKQDSSLCMPSPFKFSTHGESGMIFSELLPHTAKHADEFCMIRSLHTPVNDHEGALRHFQSGKPRSGRPTIGSWLTYALGSQNQKLPPYVVLSDPNYDQVDGIRNWSSGFLPAIYQGTPLRTNGPALFDLDLPKGVTAEMQRNQLAFLADINREHKSRFASLNELDARIAANALAGDIRDEVLNAMDVAQETAETQSLYGMDNKATGTYSRRCLMARRLIESGVRYVAVFNDNINGDPWDTHSDHNERIQKIAANADQPGAALMADLKQRGLLQDTVVMWIGEFGRLPVAQGKNGRDHNRHAYTGLIAGGGFKGGLTYGTTDEFGYKIAKNPVSISQLHATLLRQFGLDHTRLTYPFQGRDESLTNADIQPVEPLDALVS
ncbi:MAG: DUF1501 domain-containing protein [Planctomycetota bacterium]|nr:DUF1501 domain-containing protein [Planctomycetota bacterium]MDA1211909.1 DUF1501 domain-containing protein [Planctomycetota bacterium]